MDVSTVPSLFATGVGEELNFLALNLADDIRTGQIDADKARLRYGEIKTAFTRGENNPVYTGSPVRRAKRRHPGSRPADD